MKKLLMLLTACLFTVCFSTHAFSGEGPYVGLNIGTSWVSDADLTDDTVTNETLELEYDFGFAGGIAIGYGFNDTFRLEGEFFYATNDLDKITLNGVSLAMDGETSLMAFLLNVYVDFANDSDFTPFITAGVGYAEYEMDDFTITGSGITPVSDDDGVFAGQVGAGIGYALSDTVMVDLKYRFLFTQDPELGSTNLEYANHSVILGLRLSF